MKDREEELYVKNEEELEEKNEPSVRYSYDGGVLDINTAGLL